MKTEHKPEQVEGLDTRELSRRDGGEGGLVAGWEFLAKGVEDVCWCFGVDLSHVVEDEVWLFLAFEIEFWTENVSEFVVLVRVEVRGEVEVCEGIGGMHVFFIAENLEFTKLEFVFFDFFKVII